MVCFWIPGLFCFFGPPHPLPLLLASLTALMSIALSLVLKIWIFELLSASGVLHLGALKDVGCHMTCHADIKVNK